MAISVYIPENAGSCRQCCDDITAPCSAGGHDIDLDVKTVYLGGAQLIYKLGDGYLAASDHRNDGQAAGF